MPPGNQITSGEVKVLYGTCVLSVIPRQAKIWCNYNWQKNIKFLKLARAGNFMTKNLQSVVLDGLDQAILHILQEDGRVSNGDLAKKSIFPLQPPINV